MDASPRLAALLAGVLAAVGVFGALLAASTATAWWAIATGAVAILIGFIQYRILRVKTHQFKNETSPRFVKFFSGWYAQPGSHFVFCKDLDWISLPQTAVILAAICKHASAFQFFVSDDSARACTDIVRSGGIVYRIPREIAEINVKLSLLKDQETSRIIFRKKIGDHVKFQETADANTVALAESLIHALREIDLNQRHEPIAQVDPK